MSDEDSIFDASQTAAIQNVIGVYEANRAEITELNARLSELRSEFQAAFNKNELESIFCEVEENGEEVYYTDEYNKLESVANELGLGFSYEGYFLWKPSTRSC